MKSCLMCLCLVLLFLTGCTNIKCNYSGTNYSKSMYKYQTDPTPEARQERIAALQRIVKYAKSERKKIAPGIYMELAVLTKAQDISADVAPFLDKELELYPESVKQVQFLQRKLIVGVPSE